MKTLKGYFDLALQFANEQPYMFAASIAAGFLPIILVFLFCGFKSSPAPTNNKKKASAADAAKKKNDDIRRNSNTSSDDDDDEDQDDKPVIGTESKIEELPDEPAEKENAASLRKRQK
jgi:hypothetical protein